MMTFKSAVKTAPLPAAVLLAVLGLCAAPVGAQQIAVNPANGHIYHELPSADWDTQKAAAVALGGYLVTINDAAENQWLTDTFFPGTDAFIGYTDEVTEGTFVWLSGEPATYENWNGGEPNDWNNGDPGEDLTELQSTAGWNDVQTLDNSQRAIAEIIPGPSVTITRDGAVDEAFTSGSGSWTVTFSEDVINVTDDDFSVDTLGDAAITGGPTVIAGAGASYTVEVTGVTGASGAVVLNFDVGDVLPTAGGNAPNATSAGSQWYTNIVPAPAAMGWVLVFLAIVLVLAAAVMLRRKALKH